ncbi:MAG: hypothetical protein AVDCRST_MAG03-1218 [uncultured Rubrobacteraceae bacterium]|uniref:Uncharacterized protein n=1 Tax=uncultured Rubrobacteraceae bacterium TaxID=349277 RepID=A0A6J4NYK4_9ACTN|nr:MAG: hypothetical protein AVDCRST_MAG03-1218 [uncultured Rubrobacteraceae bacterium]
MHRDTETGARADAEDRRDHPPRVADALKSGVTVSIATWSGRQLRGTVSDRDATGLLLDLDDGADGQGGYAFLPWSSVEQVDIPEVAHRPVKFLQG